MRLERLKLRNVRSFCDEQEISLAGPISIIVGPNGGGKTNLLDTIVIMLRRYLYEARYIVPRDQGGGNLTWSVETSQNVASLTFEKHSAAISEAQMVQADIIVSKSDLDSMKVIKDDNGELIKRTKMRLNVNPWQDSGGWDVESLKPGDVLSYKWDGSSITDNGDLRAQHFRSYLQIAELDNTVRSDLGMASLQMPMVYLPVNRASAGFQSMVRLADYNDVEQARMFAATSSRSSNNLIQLAVGRLARKFRHLQERDNVSAKEAFRIDPQIQSLTQDLQRLGYGWNLETINIEANQYDVRLEKQGSSFLVSAASSGERKLLTYLFAIHALNVRDALILIDEPELHLHPKWQSALFNLFERLARETGNQFVMATHSPSFITPDSIQYVSRVYAEDQRSRIVRLNSASLPDSRHLFSIVNSQSNERLFFADHVVLVEGLSDRIVFERCLEICRGRKTEKNEETIEIVSVGGKGLFAAYKKLLDACAIKSSIIADLDYLNQIGSQSVKQVFTLDAADIKRALNDIGSIDAQTLVMAIDEAFRTRSWDDAENIWAYMKSRRVSLKSDLPTDMKTEVDAFILQERNESIYILSKGALEAYMPEGYRSKDIGKLIELVNDDNFWDRLPASSGSEIEAIMNAILR